MKKKKGGDTVLPQPFLSRMERLLGEDYPRFLAAYDMPAARGLHAGLAKIASEDLAALLGDAVRPTPFAEDCFYYLAAGTVGGNPLHHAGAFYMQEPSAMLPVVCLEVEPEERVLDLCAAPGGKSTEIANRLAGRGVLVANEYVTSRSVILAGNLERMGVTNAVVTNADAETVAKTYPAFFDAVLVDAPCSGEGLFRREPAAVSEWSEESVRACAERQRQILDSASETVRPGGRLVYSTCTFSVEENEETVLYFLARHPDFSLEKVPESVEGVTVAAYAVSEEPLAKEVARYARRAYPHTAPGEGQFMAKFVRATGAPIPARNKKKGRDAADAVPLTNEEEKAWKAFLTGAGIDPRTLPAPLRFKDGISLLAEDIPLVPKQTYARGVYAGTVEKGRLVPGHYLFSAYGKHFARKLELSPTDPRLGAYLRGETIPCDLPDGWAVVTVAGCPLGGIKVVSGTAKNHYPKGLRLRQ